MKKLALVLGLILLFSVVLTACSSGGSSSGGSNSASVTMTDFKFDPNTVTVSAGKQVTVNLKNNGSVAHTWTVMSKPITGSYTSADQGNILFSSGEVAPGSTKTVNFTAPANAGDYQIICTVPGHFESGMVGHLIVK